MNLLVYQLVISFPLRDMIKIWLFLKLLKKILISLQEAVTRMNIKKC